MSDAKKRSGSLLQFILIFLIVYLGSQYLMQVLFPRSGTTHPEVTLSVGNVTVGNNATMTVHNGTASGFLLHNRCPAAPVDVFRVAGEGSGAVLTAVTGSQVAVPCTTPAEVPANGTVQVNLSPWKYALFSGTGTYEVRLPLYAVSVGTGALASTGALSSRIHPAQTLSARFTVSNPGFFTKIFRTFISAPFLNFLIFVASLLPDHNLGIAIIVLTIVVKLLLFLPTQHAMEGQRKMQMLQPKMEEIKKRYSHDPQKVQEETVKLWKEHKVNPFQSCLPTLVQFPVLIGLFYVVRDQSTLELSRHLIYPFYQHLTWHFGTSFLWMDLLKPNIMVMPPLLVILQFLQMKMAFSIADKKRRKQTTDGGAVNDPVATMQTQQKVMLYALPLMIGVFAFRFPAAVAVYWGVSTLFGVGQQWIVNREHLKP